ncbi:MAG: 3-dehydroquinate synthase [Acidobacteria bacterium 13_1_20CM_3_53_8]|nr:MAG: 3-dehydroquinate synthase [Acidobacteria bacterium 13_1_20CM_3_53_8]
MKVERIRVRLPARARSYEILIEEGALVRLGAESALCLDKAARRVALISNRTVFKLYGERAARSLSEAGFEVAHWLMSDGERHKSLKTLERALEFLSEVKLERSDAVVALGGGVVGDLAGFAAAVYMRGVAFVQVPTTLLAQIDASVGGKVAVNTSVGKNLVGAFHQPRAVLIDINTLATLPRRELTSGLCECVKQAAVASRKLFEETVSFLEKQSSEAVSPKQNSFAAGLSQLIAAHVKFKASIVAGDEREDLARMDSRSRRVLNFGHTTAHALEAVTDYRRFRHGEAVGYGLLVACEISKRLGMLAISELESLSRAVCLCGRPPRTDDLDIALIEEALAHDKKRVGGSLKWVLLERIGRARVVDGRDIPPEILRDSLRAVLHKSS